jgi:outer membrane usher protein FimD/PapC
MIAYRRCAATMPLLCILVVGILIAPRECPGQEHLVLEIILNTQKKGEFFAYLTEDRDFLLSKEDLIAMGFADPTGTTSEKKGGTFVSLRSMEGLSFTFNEKLVSLEITAVPRLLRKRSVDLKPARRADVYYPRDTGGFLNYGLSYRADGPFDNRSFGGTTQFGVRTGDILFLNDSTYTRDDTGERLVRLSTNTTYESRLDLNRTVLGDLYAASGHLGSAVNMGGISFSRNFRIDPYFIKQPIVDYTGFAALPSEVKVSIDGAQVRSDKVSPGPFDLKNILAFNGVHDLEITVKDAFGREETLRYPFYSSDILLRAGLHEFSYNAGFLRNNYGTVSNDYGRFVVSFFHSYGITDFFTIGARGEGFRDRVNAGPRMSLLLGNYGVLSLSTGASAIEGGPTGYAGSLGYTYQRPNVSLRFLYNEYTRAYSTIATRSTNEKTRRELGAGIGFGMKAFGSISFDFGSIDTYTGRDRESYTLNYSRSITRDSSIYLSMRHTRDDDTITQFNLGLTVHLWKETMLSVSLQKDNGSDYQGTQIQKSAPVGEGFGYRVSASRSGSSGSEADSVNPFVQYNGPYGIYTAEFTANYPTGSREARESMGLNASGGIAYVGRTISFGRPVSDSYGLVKVGDLKGVGVYHNNHLIGHTDSSGKLFIPNMYSYTDNYVSIDDKDIPMEYSFEKVGRYVSPPLRSGTFLPFDAAKIHAFMGRLETKSGGKTIPLCLLKATLTVNGRDVPFVTNGKGEFYLDNINPGRYTGTVRSDDGTYIFTIAIPRSDDTIVNLGGVLAEERH